MSRVLSKCGKRSVDNSSWFALSDSSKDPSLRVIAIHSSKFHAPAKDASQRRRRTESRDGCHEEFELRVGRVGLDGLLVALALGGVLGLIGLVTQSVLGGGGTYRSVSRVLTSMICRQDRDGGSLPSANAGVAVLGDLLVALFGNTRGSLLGLLADEVAGLLERIHYDGWLVVWVWLGS